MVVPRVASTIPEPMNPVVLAFSPLKLPPSATRPKVPLTAMAQRRPSGMAGAQACSAPEVLTAAARVRATEPIVVKEPPK